MLHVMYLVLVYNYGGKMDQGNACVRGITIFRKVFHGPCEWCSHEERKGHPAPAPKGSLSVGNTSTTAEREIRVKLTPMRRRNSVGPITDESPGDAKSL